MDAGRIVGGSDCHPFPPFCDKEVGMFRLLWTAAIATLLLPAVSLADKKAAKPASDILPVEYYGESKPSGCKSCGNDGPIYPAWMSHGSLGVHAAGYGAFGDELRYQLLWDQHECAPDGCIKPLGCGNFWTELKFIFGSCRQFYGTAESTVGHHRNTTDRWATPPFK
jgi:hypothetical protein